MYHGLCSLGVLPYLLAMGAKNVTNIHIATMLVTEPDTTAGSVTSIVAATQREKSVRFKSNKKTDITLTFLLYLLLLTNTSLLRII